MWQLAWFWCDSWQSHVIWGRIIHVYEITVRTKDDGECCQLPVLPIPISTFQWGRVSWSSESEWEVLECGRKYRHHSHTLLISIMGKAHGWLVKYERQTLWNADVHRLALSHEPRAIALRHRWRINTPKRHRALLRVGGVGVKLCSSSAQEIQPASSPCCCPPPRSCRCSF